MQARSPTFKPRSTAITSYLRPFGAPLPRKARLSGVLSRATTTGKEASTHPQWRLSRITRKRRILDLDRQASSCGERRRFRFGSVDGTGEFDAANAPATATAGGRRFKIGRSSSS